jgi:fructose-bisphosphate aldolase, class II
MLDGAADGSYAFPAINITSSQTLNAAMRGFAETGSDNIVQVTVGGARYLSGAADDGLTGARAFAALGQELTPRYPVAIALHTDHCPPEHADSFLRPSRIRTCDPLLRRLIEGRDGGIARVRAAKQ